jgi:hypothetical protein
LYDRASVAEKNSHFKDLSDKRVSDLRTVNCIHGEGFFHSFNQIQSNLVKRDIFKRDFILSGTLSLPFIPISLQNHDGEEGICSKRDCLAVILTSRLKRFACSHLLNQLDNRQRPNPEILRRSFGKASPPPNGDSGNWNDSEHPNMVI